jgi:hypothetical protein
MLMPALGQPELSHTEEPHTVAVSLTVLTNDQFDEIRDTDELPRLSVSGDGAETGQIL